MKRALAAAILCVFFLALTLLSYGQRSGAGTSTAPAPTTGAYDPHPGPAAMNAPPPIDQHPQDYLAQDPKFNAKLQKLLPEGVTTLQACDGFKKLGDCVAAIHASQNLAIPLADLKLKVTGKGAENLEKAVHDLKPDVDAKAERKKAWKQAERDIPVSN